MRESFPESIGRWRRHPVAIPEDPPRLGNSRFFPEKKKTGKGGSHLLLPSCRSRFSLGSKAGNRNHSNSLLFLHSQIFFPPHSRIFPESLNFFPSFPVFLSIPDFFLSQFQDFPPLSFLDFLPPHSQIFSLLIPCFSLFIPCFSSSSFPDFLSPLTSQIFPHSRIFCPPHSQIFSSLIPLF